MLTENFFFDTDCTYPYISISQQGVLAYSGVFQDATGQTDWLFQRNTPNYQITPHTNGSVTYLNNNCPCTNSLGLAQNWTVGATTTLTTCPQNDCDGTIFLHGGAFGQPNWGGVQAFASASFQQLRFTELATTAPAVPTTFSNTDFPFVDQSPCQFSLATDRWCGNYRRFCTASNRGDGYDFTESITFDAPESNGVGAMTRNYYLFNTSNNCGDGAVAALSAGQTYVVGAAAPVSVGGYNFQVTTNIFTVLPQDPSIVSALNTGCSCGGTWSNYVPRNIFGCTTCNVPFINNYELSGQPFYTNILVYPQSLRYGNWSNSSQVGYNTPLGITNFPLVKQNECIVPPIVPSSASSKFPGGGVFLILLFIPLFVYFLVGMALNYKNSGAATIPHKDFWVSLPGLVVSGCKFAFVEFFGLRAASSSGYTPQTNKAEGYGTLGE
jgi:hypothetical protein